MIFDPAGGATRAQRAFGPAGVPAEPGRRQEMTTGMTSATAVPKPLPMNRSINTGAVKPVNLGTTNSNVGMFSGPRPSYQKYQASPAASGVIKTAGKIGMK